MAKKLTERDKLESVFSNPLLSEVEARHLLDLAGVIVRSRFPGTGPAKRGRKAKPQVAPPISQDAEQGV